MMVPVGVLFFLLFIFILLRRVNGDGAKPPATRINCWMVLNIVEITVNASTMMTTQEDWLANVTLDIRSTECILVCF